jgi:predicted Zn-dependent peptidase
MSGLRRSSAQTLPTRESIDALSRESLFAWHRERYAPQNAILGIAGDVRAKELLPKLEKWLAAWKPNQLVTVLPPNPMPAPGSKVFLVDRPNSVQTTVALGNIAIDRRSPDYFPMVVMNHIIGGGASARLFLNLREEKGTPTVSTAISRRALSRSLAPAATCALR